MSTKKKMLQAAAGNVGGGGTNVEDVFSTYLYTGSSSTQTTTNGVDLAGEGGLVWIKSRDNTRRHCFHDTERGGSKQVSSNLDAAERTLGSSGTVTFNSDGWSVPSGDGDLNASGFGDFASWTFRKAPKFFDIVTWTGDGVAGREIAHDLGCEVGHIMVKNYGTTRAWINYHRTLGGTKYLEINNTNAAGTVNTVWDDTDATSTHFTVGTNTSTNASGNTYVAYLFAHNDGDGEFGPDGDADIIKCGSYTGNFSANGPDINLGFEPQFVLVKSSSNTGDWHILDNMRGISTGGNEAILKPNRNYAETNPSDYMRLTPTGFKIDSSGYDFNGSGYNFIYIAIRRGTKVPESGTEVFEPTAYTGNNLFNRTIGNLTIDMNLLMDRNRGSSMSEGGHVWDRLRGEDVALKTNVNLIENTGWSDDFYNLDQQYGFSNGNNASYLNNTSADYISYIWKRAPKFFDVVNYVGDGTGDHDVSHSLGVAPEMIWVKSRDASYTNDWRTYHKDLTSNAYYLKLHSTDAEVLGTDTYAETDPTSSVFTVGESITTNKSGDDYIAYLFATLDGVSKVGSYTGNGTSQTIDCGFTTGARFVLIKQTTDLAGTGFGMDWYVYDTARGIVVGNDKRLSLNTDAAEITPDDVYPDASGFGVTGTNTPNTSGESYIFYAIA